MALLGFVFRLEIDGAWVDVTDYVRHQKVNLERGTKDWSKKLTPAKAKLVLLSPDDRFNPSNPASPYYGKLVRNMPIQILCDGGVANAERFTGEVFAFRPRWDAKGNNKVVEVEAAGALRRIVANDVTPRSYYRSWLNTRTFAPRPYYHWALEEGPDAEVGLPDTGQGAAYLVPYDASAAAAAAAAAGDGRAWGQADMNDWHPNGVKIPNLHTLWLPSDVRGSTAGAWEISGIFTHTANETVTQLEINCGTAVWYMSLYTVLPDYNIGRAMVIRPDGTVALLGDELTNLKDLGPIWFTFRCTFSGSTINAYWAWRPVGAPSNAISITTVTTMSAAAQVYPRYIGVSSVANTADNTSTTSATGLKDLSVSQSALGSVQMGLSYAATKGGPSEETDERFTRMCTEQGLNNTASVFGSMPMGRQYLESFEEHLVEILASGRHSGIVESRSVNALALLGLAPNRGNIDLTEIIPELEPAEDDKDTANIIELENSHAAKVTLRKDTGTMSTVDIGPFTAKMRTNSRNLSEALALGGLALARGTWPGPRFAAITVSARLNPARYAFYRSIDVGDFIGLTGMDVHGYPDTMLFRVTWIGEAISQEDHLFTFAVRPGELEWNLWVVGTNRVDIADSTVAVASAGATIDVNVPGAKWSLTGVPYDLMIAGERVTVTGVANLTATTQRLTVTRSVNGIVKTAPVGAEVHIYPNFYIRAV